jgi:ketosteroid isomerase-like protein
MPARSPDQVHPVFAQVFNSGDLNAVLAMYEPKAGMDAEAGKFVQGQEAIREVFAGFLALKGTIAVKTTRCVQVGELAVLHGSWTLAGKGPDGKPVNLSGKTTEVVRRQPDGTWRFVIDLPAE